MASNYPGAIDAFTPPTASDTMDGAVGGAAVEHDVQHANFIAAIEAIETALGITGAFHFIANGGSLTDLETRFTAAGQLVVGTGSGTGELLTAGAPGTVLTGTGAAAVPAYSSAPLWNGVNNAALLSGYKAENFPRGFVDGISPNAGGSGYLWLTAMYLPAGLSLTDIAFFSGSTAASVPLNQWFALYNSALALLAVTADDTTTAWAANTLKSLAISGGFTTTYSGLYYVGYMVKASTVPTILGKSTLTATTGPAPGLTFVAGGGTYTIPATAPNPASPVAPNGVWQYAAVS